MPTPSPTAGSSSQTNGFWTLFATILASSMAFIDGSALNVALPALQADLGASGAALLWIVNAYNVLLAALILVGGALGDRYGRKLVFMYGIALFAAASLVCGLAPNTAILIAARAVQGVGGALMVPGSLSLITASFGENERGKAIGTWSSFSTLTTILGPVLGGVLAGNGLWRFIFFINLPLAAAALAVLMWKVPESREQEANKPLDIWGALFASIGLAGLTYGLIEAPSLGWSNPVIVASLLLGLAALISFVVVQRRSSHPMMPLSLFRVRQFSGTNGMTLLLYAALYGLLFFFPLNLIQVQGYPEALAGLAALPSSLLLAVLSRYTGALSDRYGPRLPLTVGPALAGVGFLLFALPGITRGPSDYWTTYFPAICVFGLGLAITVAPLTSTVMGAVPSHQAGVASGINNAIARTAGVMAVAMLGAFALFTFTAELDKQAQAIGLNDSARVELRAEATKLGGATPPAGISAEASDEVNVAIKTTFITTFRRIAYTAACLAWLSALIAWITLGAQPKTQAVLASTGG